MTPNRTMLMNSREQSRLQWREGWGACSVPVCYPAASSHPTILKTFCRDWHFLRTAFLYMLLCCSMLPSEAVACSVKSCPNSHWGKWYGHWRAFWQLPASLTGFHSTRRSWHLFLGWTTAQMTTEKCSGTIHTTIQPCHKTNSTITWGKLQKNSNRKSKN